MHAGDSDFRLREYVVAYGALGDVVVVLERECQRGRLLLLLRRGRHGLLLLQSGEGGKRYGVGTSREAESRRRARTPAVRVRVRVRDRALVLVFRGVVSVRPYVVVVHMST